MMKHDYFDNVFRIKVLRVKRWEEVLRTSNVRCLDNYGRRIEEKVDKRRDGF